MSAIQPIPALLLAATLTLASGCAPARDRAMAANPQAWEVRQGVQTTRPFLQAESHRHWESGFDAAYTVALRNLHNPNSFHTTRQARAAPRIHGVHLWDSAFLSQVWKGWDVATAQEVLTTVLDQARDGRVPHFSHRLLRSAYTQPPVIAWAVWENFQWSADTTALAAAYPALQRYDVWLHDHRTLPSGLFFWMSHLESGMDNSPRFDGPRPGRARDIRQVAAIDLSSYVVQQSAILALAADVLGRTAEAEVYRLRSEALRGLINESLWDPESGFYYDRDELTGELIRVRSSAALVTLFAGVPDSARAARLRDHVMDPAAFNTEFPLPTVALDDALFSRDMWRGPVWINLSYMIIRGLDAYGFSEEAADLAFRTVDGVYRTHQETGHFWEFYDPEQCHVRDLHRKRGELWKRIVLGDGPLPNYGWSALVNKLVIEYLVGYRRSGGNPTVFPRLPAAAAGMQLRLSVPDRGLVISVRALEDGRTAAEVEVSTGAQALILAPGEAHTFGDRPALAASAVAPR
jgi:hypothetical protein